MVTAAFLFPGQGSQYVGMGKTLVDHRSCARLFETARDVLGWDLAKLCLEGPKETLTRTQYSQPAIFVMSLAALTLLSEASKGPRTPLAVCGLSLGEYTALVACGVLSFEEALRAVKERGRLMEDASNRTPGTLAAIFGLSLETVQALCRETGTEVANLNGPGQIVVSGRIQDVEAVTAFAKERGAKRALRLDVSGPFHSRFMREAGEALGTVLSGLSFHKPACPFISNVTARFEEEPDRIRENLVRQVSETVLWEASVRLLLSRGIRTFFEIGPGNVLAGLNRKIDPGIETEHLETPEDVAAWAGEKRP